MGSNDHQQRLPRCLCLHGIRTSGDILKKQVAKWPETLRHKLDLVFVDAPFPAQGKSDVEGIFDPPYYEWFHVNHSSRDLIVYDKFKECVDYIEDCMINHGPFDGLLGFSQGAFLAAALSGLQAQGLALNKVPQIKCSIIISGAKLRDKSWSDKAFASPVQCPSIHLLSEADVQYVIHRSNWND